MKVTAQYFGANLSSPEGTDVEHFESIQSARKAFLSRADFDPQYPCQEEESSEILLWKGVLDDVTDYYPDYRLCIGSRGGANI